MIGWFGGGLLGVVLCPIGLVAVAVVVDLLDGLVWLSSGCRRGTAGCLGLGVCFVVRVGGVACHRLL